MIKTLFLQPLGPSLLLALGVLVLYLEKRIARGYETTRRPFLSSGRGARIFALLRIATAWLFLLWAFVLLIQLGFPAAQASVHWAWQPLTVAGSLLQWQRDSWNWLVACLLLLLTAAVLALQSADGTSSEGLWFERTLGLAAAALAFVFSNNVVTLASCWVLMDAIILLRLHPERTGEPAGRAWGLLSLTGLAVLAVLALLGEGEIRTTLDGGRFDRLELGLLWIAALVRAGVYPLHFWLTSTSHLRTSERVSLHLLVPLTGLWLLARVHQSGGPEWLRRPEWAALGALALLGTALAAWAVSDSRARWRWVAVNRASLVVMVAYVAERAGPPALVWAAVTFAFGGAVLALGLLARVRWHWRWPLWLGALAVWGVPGTPGFLAHSGLVYPVELQAAIPLFGIILIAESLLVAALWQWVIGEGADSEDRKPAQGSSAARFLPFDRLAMGQMILALAMLAVPLVTWGLYPRQLVVLTGMPVDADAPTLFGLIANARRSVSIGFVLSGIVGGILGAFRTRIFAHMRGWQEAIVSIVSLEWAYRAAGAGLGLFGTVLQYFASLGEGEGYLGWLVLAGLIFWVLIWG